jgi:hypothetical protein
MVARFFDKARCVSGEIEFWLERATSRQSVPHRFTLAAVSQIPSAGRGLHDFRFSSLITLESGRFYNVFAGSNRTNIKDLNTLYGAPDLSRPPAPNLGFGTPRNVFNPFQFQDGAKFRF